MAFGYSKTIDGILKTFNKAIKDLESHVAFHKDEVVTSEKTIENLKERISTSQGEVDKATSIIENIKKIVGQ